MPNDHYCSIKVNCETFTDTASEPPTSEKKISVCGVTPTLHLHGAEGIALAVLVLRALIFYRSALAWI